MVVYRYLSEEEFKNIVSGNIKNTGNVFYNANLSNTFRYKRDEKYLHFFKKIKDFPKIQAIRRDYGGKFLCKFDIPLRILITRAGKGYYDSTKKGYVYDYDMVREFAVESKKMETEFLIDFVYDKFCNMTVEQAEKCFESQKNQTALEF